MQIQVRFTCPECGGVKKEQKVCETCLDHGWTYRWVDTVVVYVKGRGVSVVPVHQLWEVDTPIYAGSKEDIDRVLACPHSRWKALPSEDSDTILEQCEDCVATRVRRPKGEQNA